MLQFAYHRHTSLRRRHHRLIWGQPSLHYLLQNWWQLIHRKTLTNTQEVPHHPDVQPQDQDGDIYPSIKHSVKEWQPIHRKTSFREHIPVHQTLYYRPSHYDIVATDSDDDHVPTHRGRSYPIKYFTTFSQAFWYLSKHTSRRLSHRWLNWGQPSPNYLSLYRRQSLHRKT